MINPASSKLENTESPIIFEVKHFYENKKFVFLVDPSQAQLLSSEKIRNQCFFSIMQKEAERQPNLPDRVVIHLTGIESEIPEKEVEKKTENPLPEKNPDVKDTKLEIDEHPKIEVLFSEEVLEKAINFIYEKERIKELIEKENKINNAITEINKTFAKKIRGLEEEGADPKEIEKIENNKKKAIFEQEEAKRKITEQTSKFFAAAFFEKDIEALSNQEIALFSLIFQRAMTLEHFFLPRRYENVPAEEAKSIIPRLNAQDIEFEDILSSEMTVRRVYNFTISFESYFDKISKINQNSYTFDDIKKNILITLFLTELKKGAPLERSDQEVNHVVEEICRDLNSFNNPSIEGDLNRQITVLIKHLVSIDATLFDHSAVGDGTYIPATYHYHVQNEPADHTLNIQKTDPITHEANLLHTTYSVHQVGMDFFQSQRRLERGLFATLKAVLLFMAHPFTMLFQLIFSSKEKRAELQKTDRLAKTFSELEQPSESQPIHFSSLLKHLEFTARFLKEKDPGILQKSYKGKSGRNDCQEIAAILEEGVSFGTHLQTFSQRNKLGSFESNPDVINELYEEIEPFLTRPNFEGENSYFLIPMQTGEGVNAFSHMLLFEKTGRAPLGEGENKVPSSQYRLKHLCFSAPRPGESEKRPYVKHYDATQLMHGEQSVKLFLRALLALQQNKNGTSGDPCAITQDSTLEKMIGLYATPLNEVSTLRKASSDPIKLIFSTLRELSIGRQGGQEDIRQTGVMRDLLTSKGDFYRSYIAFLVDFVEKNEAKLNKEEYISACKNLRSYTNKLFLIIRKQEGEEIAHATCSRLETFLDSQIAQLHEREKREKTERAQLNHNVRFFTGRLQESLNQSVRTTQKAKTPGVEGQFLNLDPKICMEISQLKANFKTIKTTLKEIKGDVEKINNILNHVELLLEQNKRQEAFEVTANLLKQLPPVVGLKEKEKTYWDYIGAEGLQRTDATEALTLWYQALYRLAYQFWEVSLLTDQYPLRPDLAIEYHSILPAIQFRLFNEICDLQGEKAKALLNDRLSDPDGVING